jgi:WD40 repeat protein
VWSGKDGRPVVDNALWVNWGYPYRNTCFFASQFSPNGKILAVAGVDGEEWRGCIHLFDPRTQSHVRELSGHSEGVHALAFSPYDALLASGGKDGILRLWNTGSGQLVACFDLGVLSLPRRDEQRYSVMFARRFYSDPGFLPSAIHSLAFARDGQFVVIGTDSGAVLRVDVACNFDQA